MRFHNLANFVEKIVFLAPKQLRGMQRLSKAYSVELDSINAAITFIEQRKLELLMEDEMAIVLAMMCDDA